MKTHQKRLTLKQAKELIKKQMEIDLLGTFAIRNILEEIIPFSWHMYCKDNNLNPNLLMDKHERGYQKSLKDLEEKGR